MKTKRDYKSLKARKNLIEMALRLIEESQDDPRYLDAKQHYQKQLEEVEFLLIQNPPDIVVGLKTANTVSRVMK